MLMIALLTTLMVAGPPQSVALHTVKSPYLAGPVAIEVLAPESIAPERRYRVLYILPVAAGTTSRWGSGIEEAARADIANRFGVFCVAPAYDSTPWFANHPTDPALRQESHFLDVVIPWVEANLPVEQSRQGRLLLGFSKSGYGAVMLLLRHPDRFERAVAWDAPLGKTAPDQFNMIEVFGTSEHFEGYAIPRLLVERAEALRPGPARIVLMPDREGDHPMENVRKQMESLGIPFQFESTTGLKHHWASGWLPRAAELVLGETPISPPESPAPR